MTSPTLCKVVVHKVVPTGLVQILALGNGAQSTTQLYRHDDTH